MRPYEQAAHDLALRYGTDLPKPAKPKLRLPSFALGSTSTMYFTPSGDHLLVPTANGCFLWEVATGKKLCRLKGPANPSEFSFSPDGRRLLMRNEVSQFGVFSIPEGELLASFRAKHEFRMDGSGCLGPDEETVLQLAYGGTLLVLDSRNGRVLAQHALEPTGCSGQIHWFPGRQEVWISQLSVNNGRNVGTPCGLWRWSAPLGSNPPVRLPGRWIDLHTSRLSGREALLLHHRPEAGRPQDFVMQVLDLTTGQAGSSQPCSGGIQPMATYAHDGRAWSVATNQGIQLTTEDGELQLPIQARAAAFHPSRDLVAIPGDAAFVVPRSAVPALMPMLQLHADELNLRLRGGGRMTTLPERVMPPRLVVFESASGWLLQSERLDGRRYQPLEGATLVPASASIEARAAALTDSLQRSRAGTGPAEAATPGEWRGFLGGTVTPPSGGWRAAVAVSFADDAIDLWPMKPSEQLAFVHTWYPVAAIAPDTHGAELVHAIERMLRHFQPRKERSA